VGKRSFLGRDKCCITKAQASPILALLPSSCRKEGKKGGEEKGEGKEEKRRRIS